MQHYYPKLICKYRLLDATAFCEVVKAWLELHAQTFGWNYLLRHDVHSWMHKCRSNINTYAGYKKESDVIPLASTKG